MGLKKLALISALLCSNAALAYEITPFNLAMRAYRGAYKEVIQENNKRLGAYNTFCSNFSRSKSKVTKLVADSAVDENRLDSYDDGYLSSLKFQIYNTCFRSNGGRG